jgi:hypothetical protein
MVERGFWHRFSGLFQTSSEGKEWLWGERTARNKEVAAARSKMQGEEILRSPMVYAMQTLL